MFQKMGNAVTSAVSFRAPVPTNTAGNRLDPSFFGDDAHSVEQVDTEIVMPHQQGHDGYDPASWSNRWQNVETLYPFVEVR